MLRLCAHDLVLSRVGQETILKANALGCLVLTVPLWSWPAFCQLQSFCDAILLACARLLTMGPTAFGHRIRNTCQAAHACRNACYPRDAAKNLLPDKRDLSNLWMQDRTSSCIHITLSFICMTGSHKPQTHVTMTRGIGAALTSACLLATVKRRSYSFIRVGSMAFEGLPHGCFQSLGAACLAQHDDSSAVSRSAASGTHLMEGNNQWREAHMHAVMNIKTCDRETDHGQKQFIDAVITS